MPFDINKYFSLMHNGPHRHLVLRRILEPTCIPCALQEVIHHSKTALRGNHIDFRTNDT